MEAWEEACSSDNEAVLIVPRHKIYHLKPVTFSGPCKSDLTMKVSNYKYICMDQSDQCILSYIKNN